MWWKSGRDPRVRDEIRFHRDQLIEGYMAAGMDRKDAERRAILEFGNALQIEEKVMDVRGCWFHDLGQDLRYTWRTLRRNPGFSATAVLSLALGIGANAAIFSLINAVMLRTLPVREPERLVQIARVVDGRPGFMPYPLFERFRDNLGSIQGVFAQATTTQAIAIDGEEEFVIADLVSGEYYRVLGIEAVAGRLLGPGDVQPSAPPAAVISDRYWQRRFGRSVSAIGTTLTLRDRVFTIVGVTPPSYLSARAGDAPDLTLPLLETMMSAPQRASPGFNWLSVMARLKPDVSVARANAEVEVVFQAFVQELLGRANEKQRADILRQRVMAYPRAGGFNPIRDSIGQPLLILMGIVALILLLACVNLSGLLIARAAARQREISIRLAIGASRGRLVRQFLTESLVLASIGGGIGLAASGWFSAWLFTVFIGGRSVVLSVAPDWRVLAFTGVVSLLACCVSGLAPALQAIRVNVNPALKEARAHGHGRFGRALVVAQLAISMVLLVGATLFVGTLVKLYAVDRGFDSSGILVMSVRSSQTYPQPRAMAVQTALLDRLESAPGVESATAVHSLAIGGGLWDRTVQVEGYQFRPDEPDQVGFNVIAPGYFATLATPLLSGREFDDRDTGTAPRVAVVNESFARHFFGGQSAIGRRVTSVGVTFEIVGVTRDAKYQDLRSDIVRTLYVPWMQWEGDQPGSYSYLARVAGGDPLRLAPGLDRLVREADPALRVRTAVSYDTVVDRSISTERIMATLGGLFGVLAIVVAGLGVFGVLAFQVARRTNELGVRMALGASRGRMMSLVLRDVVLMAAAGVAIGAAGAFALTGLARNMLFGLTPGDPAAFAAAAAVLTLAALVAGWLPARRAARVDPLAALRHD